MTPAAAPRPRSSRLAILVPFAIVTLIWGSTWLVIRDQLGVVPPGWSVTYRFILAGTIMVIYALVRRDPWAIDRTGWMFAAAIGVGQFVLNFNFVYRAEEFIASGLVAVVFALLLVPNALLARVFLGQRMGRQLIVGSAIALVGIALLFAHEVAADPHGRTRTLTGIGLTCLAILSASTSNVLQATGTAKRYPMAPILAIAMLIGAALDGLLAWAMTGPPVFEWRWGYAAGIAYLGIIASSLAFPLYYTVLRAIGPAKAAYSSVIVPVIAMLLSTLFEGYRWSVLAAAGAVLAGVGLVVALRARRPAR